MEDETFITKNITNKDVYTQLIKQDKKIDAILVHAEYTNGKVAENLKSIKEIKSKSIGCWIANHPFRFAGIVMVFFAFVISDIRQPLLEMARSLF